MEMAISPETGRLLESALESGRYESLDDLIASAVLALRLRDESKLEELRAEIQIGLDQAARGQCSPLDFEELRASVHRSARETA